MKELRRKTFLIIFIILTAILIVSIAFLNVQNYRREYESVSRTLDIMNDRGREPDFVMKPRILLGDDIVVGEVMENDSKKGSGLDDMMIMDQEVYTVELDGTTITKIISHGNYTGDFDVQQIAVEILEDNFDSNDTELEGRGKKVIENLFFSKYAYNYKKDSMIVILNTKEVADKLIKLLVWSLILFIVVEVIIYIMSRLITGWITKPAEESFKKQKDFIADASHELKTPLAVIMASADELDSNVNELSKENVTDDLVNGSNKKYIKNIKYEADRMNKLIAGMLSLSKLEEGPQKDAFKEENLSRIVEKTALVYDGVAFENAVTIETDIQEGITFVCSREEIEKMLSTIMDNAVKHSYKDSTIKVNMHKIKNTIMIKIINQGDPIASGEEEKIFERFYRADKSRNRSENRYGLGLAIAKSIAVNHDGNIRAYSKDGETTFEIVLDT